MSAALPWRIAWAIARRDLNARFRGLRLLLICLFLGTGALAAIGSLTGSIERELSERGQEILGGDVEIALWQREASDAERAALARYGRVSAGTRMQAMARSSADTAPIELKAVDSKWPLYGQLELEDGRLTGGPPPGEAFVAQGVLDRLGIARGDRFSIGAVELRVGGIIRDEPDRLGEGFQLGPSVIVNEDVPLEAELIAPGAMYRSKYRVALSGEDDPATVREELEARFPASGFEIRTRDRASPGADRFVSRMGEFLVLVGLAALVIAGIGIGGGVSAYLEARRGSIATLKILGATSQDIARIYAMQIGFAALAGSIAGLVVGALVTPLLSRALEGLLPVSTELTLDPAALAVAALYGLLVAMIFAATPLLRARRFPALALMRARVAPLARDGVAWRWIGGGAVAISLLVLASSGNPGLAALFLAGAVAVLLLLALLGAGIVRLAARLPRPASPALRGAIANLHRPGGSTGALVTALGFGLAAFVLLAAVQSAIGGNIDRRVPEQAPDYFVLDVPLEREAEFRGLIEAQHPGADIRTVPALRGAILAFGPEGAMTRTSEIEEVPDGGWALRGERGLTYSADFPPGNTLVDGDWWGPMWNGENLVSVDEEFARAVGLEVGDMITIGILGVERTARIANLRRIDWESLGFNYVLVFSPNTLRDAPHNLAATVDLPDGSGPGTLLRDLVRAFPSSSAIEVGQLLDEARTILGQVSLATFAAASVAVLAGLAVLMGAIAAARAVRTYDTVILRVLGASRRQILLMQLVEYGILCLVLGVVALALGSGLAWLVITQLFEFDWLPDWGEILAVLAVGLALVMAFALGGSLPLLRAKPAQALRAL